MGLATLLVLGIVPSLVAARTIQARQSVSCDFEIAANSGDTCSSFAGNWGLTESAFAAINPSVSCPGNLVAGDNYCVIGSVTSSPTTTAKTTAKTSTTRKTTVKTTSTTSKLTTATTTPVTTTTSSSPNQPTQSGLAANCNNFHQIVTDDSCSAIEQQYGITAANFASWNPSIDSSKHLSFDQHTNSCCGVPTVPEN